MAKHSKTLLLLASKLGLSDEDKVISKAAEFERLLQTKSISGINISDTCKLVICLDLAADMLGAELNGKTAVKYSGIKGPSYSNCKRMVEKLLELNNNIFTIALLSVTLQCTGAQQLAEEILEKYQNLAKVKINTSLPHYICMALFQACRLQKIKIAKSNVIEKSTLKHSQWSKLEAEWTKFVDNHFSVSVKKQRVSSNKKAIKENVELMEVDEVKKNKPIEPEIEPYEVWKRRILENAYKELYLTMEFSGNESADLKTPRRSPRKSHHLYSPYKSPSKVSGMKLSFSET